MLGSFPIVAFVATTDPDRARKFYEELLGLKFISRDGHAVVFDAHGVMLRVSILHSYQPQEHTVLGWRVPDIRAVAQTLTKAGVQLERYSFLQQDELGIWQTPDGSAMVAWFKDPDGNVLSISQHS